MLESIKEFFTQQIAGFSTREEPHSLELACAALMLEIGRADTRITPDEREEMIRAVREVCGFGSRRPAPLLAAAEQAVEQAVSMFEFTRVINERMTVPQKLRLIEMLWRVAYVDGRLDLYEEHYIRKIADLIHVSHPAFIQAKVRVADSLNPASRG